MLTEKTSPTTIEAKNNRIKGEAAELLRQAVESDLKASEKRRQQYNKKCSFKPLSIGSQVWKRNMRAKTFADRWVGPYVIIRPTSMEWTSCDPVKERTQRRNCALQLLKAISGASRTGQKPEEESTKFA